jgi:hypothetical protein
LNEQAENIAELAESQSTHQQSTQIIMPWLWCHRDLKVFFAMENVEFNVAGVTEQQLLEHHNLILEFLETVDINTYLGKSFTVQLESQTDPSTRTTITKKASI